MRWTTAETMGLALATGVIAALGGYYAGAHDAQVRVNDATVHAWAEVDQAHEVLTQAVRIHEDGSVDVTEWYYGQDGFLASVDHAWCVDGALCDDEPVTAGPGA